MSDIPLAPVESTQVIQDRVLDPYLKDNITIGLISSHKIKLPPSKEPSGVDKEFVFQFPQIPDYVDLKAVELYVRGSLKKSATEDLAATEAKKDEAAIVNNALHSLFDSVMIRAGCNQEKIFETMRPQKAYIRQLLTMKNCNSSDLQTHGYKSDYRLSLDGAYINDIASMGFKVSWYQASRQVEFCAPTLLDFFQTDGYLPPNTPMQLTYRMSTPDQYLVVDPSIKDDMKDGYFKIDEILLYIPVMKINPALAPYMESLTEKEPARYRFDSIDCRQYTISNEMQSKFINKVYNGGKIPQKFLIAVYEQSALIGDRSVSNLFTSTLINVEQIRVYVNGSLVREFTADFENSLYTQSFKDCINWFQASEKDHTLDYGSFKGGHRYFAIDLMEGCETRSCEPNLLQSGFVDVEVKFRERLTTTAVLLVYGISPDTLDIDSSRSCRLTRTVQ